MPWLLLVLAGILEAGWAVGLKYTDGFTRLVPSLLTGLGVIASLLLLSISARSIPIGTAYAIWVGIGASGAALLGIVLLKESASPARIFFLVLMVVAVAGLKATAND